jgi:F-type H+-transporting ATPase subunit alpha
MKKVAGTLKIDQHSTASWRLSRSSAATWIRYGAHHRQRRKNTRLLVQSQYSPMAVEKQIAILYCGTHGLLKNIPLEKVSEFEQNFLKSLELNIRPMCWMC